MSWKVGDLCVANSNQFGWTNSEIKEIRDDIATVSFLEYDGAEGIKSSDLKLFGPTAVNKKGELVTSESNLDGRNYEGWNVSVFFQLLTSV